MYSSGKKFEMQVYEKIRGMIEEKTLGVSPENWKVFLNKGYYSKDREKNIITDVSIEFYISNGHKPAIIWIWECKDYSRKIPVDDIEEFHAKLEQIGSDNTKGTVITSKSAFQESALNYARSKGIGIARLLPDEQVEWVLYNLMIGFIDIQKNHNVLKALTNRGFIAQNKNFYGISSDAKMNNESFEQYIQYEVKKISKEAGTYKKINKPSF
ncbi:restriction endonuclease [Bacillus sp. JJ1127]|uniref:restriction endonuclease n=1 Tax=Bacillus sp. JJ1127 TaxID=3122952 RepID=UPI00300088AD